MRTDTPRFKRNTRRAKGIFFVTIVVAFLTFIAFVLMSSGFEIEKITDYMYSAKFENYSYEVASKIVDFGAVDVGCSTIRSGNYFGRNLDWTYSEDAEFIVNVSGNEERYASIGVASVTGVPNRTVERGLFSLLFRFIPFYTVDGVNEKGLCVSVNEVPAGDCAYTEGTNPGAKRLCSVLAARYVLDYADSVDEAVRLLSERDIFSIEMDDEPYEIHLMLADREKTAVVEFVNNKMVVLYDQPIMTNYYLSTPELTDHAEGVERYRILEEAYHDGMSEEEILAVLKDVYYSRLYDPDTEPGWYSELYDGTYHNAAGEELTIHSDLSEFGDVLAMEREGYDSRTRDGTYWQTCHTSVYNMEEGTLTLRVQESDEVYRFALNRGDATQLQKEKNAKTASLMIPMDIVCILIAVTLLYGLLFEMVDREKSTKILVWVAIFTLFALLNDLLAWIFDSNEARLLLQKVTNYFSTIMSELLAVPFLMYEMEYTAEKSKISKWPVWLISIINVATVIILTVFVVLEKVFYFVDGVYFQGPYYFICTDVAIFNLFIIMFTILKNRKILGLHDAMTFSLYVLIPMLATLYELWNPQLELGFVTATISLLFVYVSLQAGRNNELQIRQKILEELSYYDQLTGLPNRRSFDKYAADNEAPKSMGVVYCDMNGLKLRNDSLGHKAGDEMLVRFSETLKAHFAVDTIYRISGDEFVTLLPSISRAEFDEKTEAFSSVLARQGDIASVGFAYGENAPAEEIIRDAEIQMYQAKEDLYRRNPQLDRRKTSIHNE